MERTAIQELIEKYNEHLKFDNDLETINGKDVLKIILVDLISYQVKEKQQIIDAYIKGYSNMTPEQYYIETFKQD